MSELLVIGVLAATSFGAGIVGRKALGLNRARLPDAIGKLLECLGLSVVFLAANVATILGISIASRMFTTGFVSAYAGGDISLAVFSVCQAVTFQWWRAAGGGQQSASR